MGLKVRACLCLSTSGSISKDVRYTVRRCEEARYICQSLGVGSWNKYIENYCVLEVVRYTLLGTNSWRMTCCKYLGRGWLFEQMEMMQRLKVREYWIVSKSGGIWDVSMQFCNKNLICASTCVNACPLGRDSSMWKRSNVRITKGLIRLKSSRKTSWHLDPPGSWKSKKVKASPQSCRFNSLSWGCSIICFQMTQVVKQHQLHWQLKFKGYVGFDFREQDHWSKNLSISSVFYKCQIHGLSTCLIPFSDLSVCFLVSNLSNLHRSKHWSFQTASSPWPVVLSTSSAKELQRQPIRPPQLQIIIKSRLSFIYLNMLQLDTILVQLHHKMIIKWNNPFNIVGGLEFPIVQPFVCKGATQEPSEQSTQLKATKNAGKNASPF